ncbi:MAG: hypothetical protein QOF43_269 [Gaiellaceae bacterium]|nr:hypothetical protein [Gaiellaceae bacterium]
MSRTRAALSLAGAVAALAAAGCGGGLDSKALQTEATGLQALAAEGSLLAHDAMRGDTTSPFLRVHARDLENAASGSASKLAKGTTPAARKLKALADRVSGDLDSLSRSGSDRAAQGRLERELSDLADRAEKMGASL